LEKCHWINLIQENLVCKKFKRPKVAERSWHQSGSLSVRVWIQTPPGNVWYWVSVYFMIKFTRCTLKDMKLLISSLLTTFLQAKSLFKQTAICLSFLPCNVSCSKQDAIMFSLPLYFTDDFSLPSLMRSESFLIHLICKVPVSQQ